MKNPIIRNKHIELHIRWGWLALTLSDGYFDKRPSLNICFLFFDAYFNLPFAMPNYTEDINEARKYGFYFYADEKIFDQIWFCWGKKGYVIYMPWFLDWVRTSALRKNGTWEHETKGNKKEFWNKKWNDVLWEESGIHYRYTMKSGKVQNISTSIQIQEREWRWKWFKWLRWPNLTRRCIEVAFASEIGEKTGSWKGGCIACSYEMKKDETAIQCLRRMEKERIFK